MIFRPTFSQTGMLAAISAEMANCMRSMAVINAPQVRGFRGSKRAGSKKGATPRRGSRHQDAIADRSSSIRKLQRSRHDLPSPSGTAINRHRERRRDQ